MLTSITFNEYILAKLAYTITEVQPGYYIAPTWNPEYMVADKIYSQIDISGLPCSYGVCDTPEQFIKKFGKILKKDKRNFAVFFVIVKKKNEPAKGGWRWHKWGPYVGNKRPKHEYLYDEGNDIKQAVTYHVYEVIRDLCTDCSLSQNGFPTPGYACETCRRNS